ncbi:flavodoxin family protein [Thermodesulfobacteriota bacterium]
MKKNLIVYASNTGNTEKVAKEIAKHFERHGWSNDLNKIPDDYDAKNPDFSFKDYDFVCVGSPIISELPLPQIRTVTYGEPGSHKLSLGPKCGLVFCTYGGIHLGPKEAEPALKLLEVELMHQKFHVIDSLAVPGKMGNISNPDWYFGDLQSRPNENDMKDIALFVDGIISRLKDYPYYQ